MIRLEKPFIFINTTTRVFGSTVAKEAAQCVKDITRPPMDQRLKRKAGLFMSAHIRSSAPDIRFGAVLRFSRPSIISFVVGMREKTVRKISSTIFSSEGLVFIKRTRR